MALRKTAGTTYKYLDYRPDYFHNDPNLPEPSGSFWYLGRTN